jgi:hypothetical protein
MPSNGGKARKWFFTKEMEEIMCEMWKTNIKGKLRILSENWGIPAYAIGKKVSSMGIQNSVCLTDDEKRIILRNKHLAIDKIKKLVKEKGGRSRGRKTIADFLANHARFLDNTDYYTKEDLADGFGITSRMFDNWIQKGYIVKEPDNGPNCQALFSYEAVRKFIKQHYSIINFASLEKKGYKSWFMEFLITDGQQVSSKSKDILEDLKELEYEYDYTNN